MGALLSPSVRLGPERPFVCRTRARARARARAHERARARARACAGLLDANAAVTNHDKSVSSVSLDQGAPRHLRLVSKGALDFGLLQGWINELIQTQGSECGA